MKSRERPAGGGTLLEKGNTECTTARRRLKLYTAFTHDV